MVKNKRQCEKLVGMEYIDDVECYRVKVFNHYVGDEYKRLKTELKSKTVKAFDYKLSFDYKIVGDLPSNGRRAFIIFYGLDSKTGKSELEGKYVGAKSQLNVPEGSVLVFVDTTKLTPRAWEDRDASLLVRPLIQSLIFGAKVNPNFIYIISSPASVKKIQQIINKLGDYLAGVVFLDMENSIINMIGVQNLPYYIYADDAEQKKIKSFLEHLKKQDPEGYKREVEMIIPRKESMHQRFEEAFKLLAKKKRHYQPSTIAIKPNSEERMVMSYWIIADYSTYQSDAHIVAIIENRRIIRITCKCVNYVLLKLNDYLIDFQQSLEIIINGVSRFSGFVEESVENVRMFMSVDIDPYLMYFYYTYFDTSDSYN